MGGDGGACFLLYCRTIEMSRTPPPRKRGPSPNKILWKMEQIIPALSISVEPPNMTWIKPVLAPTDITAHDRLRNLSGHHTGRQPPVLLCPCWGYYPTVNISVNQCIQVTTQDVQVPASPTYQTLMIDLLPTGVTVFSSTSTDVLSLLSSCPPSSLELIDWTQVYQSSSY